MEDAEATFKKQCLKSNTIGARQPGFAADTVLACSTPMENFHFVASRMQYPAISNRARWTSTGWYRVAVQTR